MKKKKTRAQFGSASKIIKRVIEYMLHYYKIPFLFCNRLHFDYGSRDSLSGATFPADTGG